MLLKLNKCYNMNLFEIINSYLPLKLSLEKNWNSEKLHLKLHFMKKS